MNTELLQLVFDKIPCYEQPRFIEVEDSRGRSINIGKWIIRPDGRAVLQIDLLEALLDLQRRDAIRTSVGTPECLRANHGTPIHRR